MLQEAIQTYHDLLEDLCGLEEILGDGSAIDLGELSAAAGDSVSRSRLIAQVFHRPPSADDPRKGA